MTNKKQHYLPQLYLRGFLEEPNKYLFEFNKINGKVNKRALKKICQEFDLYTLNLYDNREENLFVEKKYFHWIEVEFAQILNKLKQKEYNLTLEDKSILSAHIIILFLRSPANKKFLSNYSITDDLALNHFVNGFANFELIKNLSSELFMKKWVFCTNPNINFLTSESPIQFIFNKQNYTFDYENIKQLSLPSRNLSIVEIFSEKNVQIFFPITKDLLLIIEDDLPLDCEIIKINDQSANIYNLIQFVQNNKVFASNEESLKNIKKILDDLINPL